MPNCKKCNARVSDDAIRYMGVGGGAYCQPCLNTELAKAAEPDKVVVACSSAALKNGNPVEDGKALELFGITTMTYSQGQSLQRKKDPSLTGMQLEHAIPNSCFMQQHGRTGSVVHGAGNYTEGSALVFPIGDDQRAGTEHKMLTNIERSFAKELEAQGQYATRQQWIQVMVAGWERTWKAHRTGEYMANKQVIDKTTGQLRPILPSEVDDYINEDLHKAARELARRKREQLDTQQVDPDARLKNGLSGRNAKAPDKKLPKKRKFDEF